MSILIFASEGIVDCDVSLTLPTVALQVLVQVSLFYSPFVDTCDIAGGALPQPSVSIVLQMAALWVAFCVFKAD